MHRLLFSFLFLLSLPSPAETLLPDIEYFPSRLHAAIFRNWDIVPHDRLASVLQCELKLLHRAGKELGLSVPPPLTSEEQRRNIEIILRRNWGLMPRAQIETLLNVTPEQLDDFL